jgi:hypothetical protein
VSPVEAAKDTDNDQQQAIERLEHSELTSELKHLTPELGHVHVEHAHGHHL